MNSLREPDLALDEQLRLLADERRRRAIEALIDHPKGAISLSDLATSMDEDDDPDIELELCHIHLPKLAEAGIIEFNQRDNRVVYTGDDRIETILERLPN